LSNSILGAKTGIISKKKNTHPTFKRRHYYY
jgi:hypothetical protein